MKRAFRILSLILLYLLTTAKSCNDRQQSDAGRERSLIETTKDSLRNEFSSDTISAAFLQAMEVNAQLKLSDFYDYLMILNDPSTKEQFKSKASAMIRNLCIREDLTIQFLMPGKEEMKELTTEQLLSKAPGEFQIIERFVPSSVMVLTSFQKKSDSLYCGKMGFDVVSSRSGRGTDNFLVKTGKTVDVFLAKRDKIIGGDSIKAWTVFLGDMKITGIR